MRNLDDGQYKLHQVVVHRMGCARNKLAHPQQTENMFFCLFLLRVILNKRPFNIIIIIRRPHAATRACGRQ